MAKSFEGHRPGPGWEQVAEVEDEQPWLIFVRTGEDWTSVKVVAVGRAPNKANYWLGWNGKTFARQADLVKLLKRPVLLGAVERELRAHTARLCALELL